MHFQVIPFLSFPRASVVAVLGFALLFPSLSQARFESNARLEPSQLNGANIGTTSREPLSLSALRSTRAATGNSVLFPGSSQGGERFGASLDSDGNQAIIGAWNANQGRGGIYLSNFEKGAWSEPEALPDGFLSPDGNFGWAVALEGQHLVVSVPRASEPDSVVEPIQEAGAVVFYSNSTGSWKPVGAAFSSGLDEDAAFGYDLDLQGSVALVGEPGAEDSTGGFEAAGAAYVFDRDSQGAWQESQRLVAPEAGNFDTFGAQVALMRVATSTFAFVSAVGRQVNGPNSGAVYVFERSTSAGDFVYRQTLVAPNPAANDRFGNSITTAQGRLFVGAPGKALAGVGDRVGAVYVFERGGSGWAQSQEIRPENPQSGELFGILANAREGQLAISANSQLSKDSFRLYTLGSDSQWSKKASFQPTDLSGNRTIGESIAFGPDSLLIGAGGATNPDGKASGTVTIYRSQASAAPLGGLLALGGLCGGLIALRRRRR